MKFMVDIFFIIREDFVIGVGVLYVYIMYR